MLLNFIGLLGTMSYEDKKIWNSGCHGNGAKIAKKLEILLYDPKCYQTS